MAPRISRFADSAPKAPIDDLVTVLELVFEGPRPGVGWTYLPDEPQLTAAVVEIAEVLHLWPPDGAPADPTRTEPPEITTVRH